jgi:plasmid stabilization system protein ParE
LSESFERSIVYHVALADSASADADAIYNHIVETAPSRGDEWFEKLMTCLYSLDKMPRRCPLAREAKKAKREIRCLLFGRRRNVYRILYEVDEAKRTVWILHIRHGARRDVEARDMARPGE